MLKKRGVHWLIQDESTLIRGQKIHQTEQLRLWEAGEDLFKHSISTAICYEPVMNDGGFHYFSSDHLPHTEDEICAAGLKMMQWFDPR
jgi:hypothetical protein